MPRANRYFIPGYTWHITHRCHKKEYLLKFSKDKNRWIYWLFQAKKRYGLSVLNYMVTSNHIHLLVADNPKSGRDVIPNSIKLIAGRTAQEFNQRKSRKGAFWEDRYHATAIDNTSHLLKCLFYIDMNMVRAGVVKHPLDWKTCGLQEILSPRKRYGIVDHDHLLSLLDIPDYSTFKQLYLNGLKACLASSQNRRKNRWSSSIAVGSELFVTQTQKLLGTKALKRKIKPRSDSFLLQEDQAAYTAMGGDFENTVLWQY